MTTTLQVNDQFPDFEFPDSHGIPIRLSTLTKPSVFDEKVGFSDGYPLILLFMRGFFCPRDQEQLRQLVQFQQELTVNYGKLLAIGVDSPLVHAAFRAGLNAQWPFLSDEQRTLVKQIHILDETEGEYAYRPQPYTFVLRPDLSIHAIYNGWFFVGRPTLEELRHDLRAIMQKRADYTYEAYTTPEITRVRIPQQTWEHGAPPLGESGLPVAQGRVLWFDSNAGSGIIVRNGSDEEVFFNFTAIPGQGYRTIKAGTPVRFEVVENTSGPTARNIQQIK